MKAYATTLGLALVLLFAGCAPQPGPPPDTTAADTQAIRTLVEQFVVAWNAADQAALAPMLAADVVLMRPDGPLQQGREAVLAVIDEGYDATTIQQAATTDEVIVMGDYAYARGTWRLDPTAAAEADVQGANGKWSVLFERGADGGWQMARWMWNQEAAPQGATAP